MMSLADLIKRQLLREYCLHSRQKKSSINALIFFVVILVFFLLTMPADPRLMRIIGPGVVWMALLLSGLLSSERLFQSDYDEGIIEQWLVSGYPISALVFAKILMYWGIILMPILLLSPIMAILFGLHGYETEILMLSLLCGTPALLSLCTLTSALGTSMGQKGVLVGVILLPLTIPIMIIGSATTTAAMNHMPVSGYLACLLAFSCLALIGIPFATAAVIRVGMVE